MFSGRPFGNGIFRPPLGRTSGVTQDHICSVVRGRKKDLEKKEFIFRGYFHVITTDLYMHFAYIVDKAVSLFEISNLSCSKFAGMHKIC